MSEIARVIGELENSLRLYQQCSLSSTWSTERWEEMAVLHASSLHARDLASKVLALKYIFSQILLLLSSSLLLLNKVLCPIDPFPSPPSCPRGRARRGQAGKVDCRDVSTTSAEPLLVPINVYSRSTELRRTRGPSASLFGGRRSALSSPRDAFET